MSIRTLEDALVEELHDLMSAEQQITKALPKLAKAAQHPELRAAFEEHLEETEGHIERLKKAFHLLGKRPTAKTCEAAKGLIREGSELIAEDAEQHVKDAFLIAAGQKVEHYEIASYGTARTWAAILGHDEIAELLQETLDEEAAADYKLNELAQTTINAEALAQ